jgi:hypothetical protein
LSCETIFIKISREASDLITWLRSKTFLLSLIRENQISLNKTALAVLRIVVTRWTAHFLAYRRLLELRQSLEIIVTQEENRSNNEKLIVKGKREAKEHSRKMMKLVQNSFFWHSLARYVPTCQPTNRPLNTVLSAGSKII